MNSGIVVEEVPVAPSFRETTRVWARIGCLSFGGPAGQIALMHKTLVEEKRWISEERFLHALNYCMLLPGPEAQQLATYVGWLMHGVRGGLVAGLLFILPGFLVILGLSAAYALFQETNWLGVLFFGLKAAVLAIVIEAVIKLGRRALKGRLHYWIAALAFLALFLFNVPFPVVVIAAAFAGYAIARYQILTGSFAPPSSAPENDVIDLRARPVRSSLSRTVGVLACWALIWQAPILLIMAIDAPQDVIAEALSGQSNVFGAIFSFFSRMAVVTFGGAYAVLSYVAQVAVEHYAWLRPGEMLDGLALAETTPGPLVLVLCYVGFLAGFRNPLGMDPLLGGFLGATLAAWATFVPSFMWIFAGAPYVERLRGNRLLSASLAAITAAVVGVILNLAIWFGLHVLFAKVDRIALLTHTVSLPGNETAEMPLVAVAWPDWHSLDVAALVVFVMAAFLIFRLKLGMAKVLAFCAIAGLLLRGLDLI